MTKRSFFRRRKNGPNNDHVFGLRNFWNVFKRNPSPPTRRGSVEPNLPGETNRQFAERRRAEAAATAPAPAEKPKRASRAKKVAA